MPRSESPSRPRRRRVIRFLALLALVAVVAIVAGGGWLWRQARTAPDWYAPVDRAAPGVADRAESMEYAVAESFHRIREPEMPWAIAISEADANAWLADRLPAWIEHGDLAWPAELGLPQVRFDAEGVQVALAARVGGGEELLVARFVPSVVDGQLRLEPRTIGLGRLALPVSTMEEMLDVASRLGVVDPDQITSAFDLDGSAADEVLQRLVTGVDAEGGIGLADGRTVELLGIVTADGRIEVTNRTRPRGGD